MKKLLPFVGNLLKNTGKGAPVIDSIRKTFVAIHEGKFDPKKLLWLVVEGGSSLTFLWAILALAKHSGLTVDQIMQYIEKILSLGMGA